MRPRRRACNWLRGQRTASRSGTAGPPSWAGCPAPAGAQVPPDGVGLDPRPRSPPSTFLPGSPLPRARAPPASPAPGKGWPGSAGWADRERCGEAEDPTRLPGCGAQRGRRPGSDHCGVRPQELSGLLGSRPPAGALTSPAPGGPLSDATACRVPPGGCGGGTADCKSGLRNLGRNKNYIHFLKKEHKLTPCHSDGVEITWDYFISFPFCTVKSQEPC